MPPESRRAVHVPGARVLKRGFGQDATRDDGSAFFHDIDLELSSHRHVQIGPGHSQRCPGDLAQQPLQDRQGRASSDCPIGSGQNISKIIPLSSDSHRWFSLLLLLFFDFI